MSGAKARLPLAEAEHLGLEVLELLRPACVRVQIAGSIRRRRPDCGDIEICAVPVVSRGVDLFGAAHDGPAWNALDDLAAALRVGGVLAPRLDVNDRAAWGSAMKRATYKGFALDIFACTDPAQWAVTLAIRTGPSAFSHALVTPRNAVAKDRETGRPLCPGLCHPYLEVKGWRVRHRDDHEVYETPTEEAVFSVLGVPWIPPAERDAYIEARIAEYARGAAGVRS